MALNIVRRARVDDQALAQIPHPKLRQILASRGVTDVAELDNSARALLHFDALEGMPAAVEILSAGIIQGRKITIIGDFDADGATSTALCMLALGMLGSRQHDYLVPNRFDFGYGLSPQIVDLAHQQHSEIIVTVDNGISCFDGVERARELNMQVVITDHHLPADRLPPAHAIVNPNQHACGFPSKNLAGVGVAFYLMLALRQKLRELNWFSEQQIPEPNLAELLDLVALGTVADVVPLDKNNRVLVHQGIQRIRSGRCRPGIQAMIDVAGRNPRQLSSTDLGFVLGPRLNAAGRLDDMSLGIECLLAEDTGSARRVAVQLDSLNRERREIESSMQQEAVRVLESLQLEDADLPPGIVLYKEDFHQGVIGILAGRIKDKYYRPTIAFAHQDDLTIKGSARSIPGLHIRDLLEEISSRHPGLIDKFGGHAMAAGLSLPVSNLAAFEQAFHLTTQEWLQGMSLDGEFVSDGELAPGDFNLDFAQLIKQSGPWGQGFPEPTFDGTFELVEQRLVGEKHLKMLVREPGGELLDAIAFNVDLQIWPARNLSHVTLAYKLDINEFRGRVSLQLLVDDLAPAES